MLKPTNNQKVVSWKNMRNTNLRINGEEVPVYIVGEENKPGSIIIEGQVRDLVNAMDAGFYASTWKNAPSAMAIENINMSMPEYNSDGTFKKHTHISQYNPLINAIGTVVYEICGGGILGAIAWAAWQTLGRAIFIGMLNDGIYRVAKEGETRPIVLTTFIAESTLTFNGVVSNNSEPTTTQIIILDENPIYKEVGAAAVDNLFSTKFDNYVDPASGNIIIPTFQGLYDIVNGIESDDANITAKAIYGSFEATIGGEGADFNGINLPVWDIFQGIFPSVADLQRILGDILVKVEIITHPIVNSTTYNPIIFWGIDVDASNSPNQSE